MLVKNEEQTTNMINLTKRKLMNLAYGAECLSSKLDNWILNSNNNNYRRLRTSKLAKSCLTMLDHPLLSSKSSSSSFEDPVNNTEVSLFDKEEPVSEFAFENPLYIEELTSNKCDTNVTCRDLKKTIVNPTIKMDGDLLEVEYYYENIDFSENKTGKLTKSCSLEENSLEINTQQNNRTKTVNINTNFPKIPQYKIADNRGLSPQHCQNYKDFLIKHKDKNNESYSNNNNQENKNDNILYFQEFNPILNQFDKHRQLKQSIHKRQHDLSEQSSIVFQRGGSARINKSENKEMKPDLKSFLSFRCPNRTTKAERRVRKKYVISETVGAVWPAVLLTYDKNITVGPTEGSNNIGCFNWNAGATPQNL